MPRDEDRYRPDRPVFCGNFEYDASVREVERLFERYGPLDRVEMKTGEAPGRPATPAVACPTLSAWKRYCRHGLRGPEDTTALSHDPRGGSPLGL